MENAKAIIAIVAIFLGLPVAILVLYERMSRWGVRRPMFWLALPLLLGFGILMPLCIEGWTSQRIILMVALEMAVLLFLLGLFGFAWSFRALSFLLFLAYLAYVVDEFAFSERRFSLQGRRSEASPRNALIGLVVIGLPCLWFTFTGGRRRQQPEDQQTEDEDDDT